MSTDNNFIDSVISTVGASAIIMVCGLITGSLTAHLLGPEGRGELAAIQLYGTLLGTMVAVGLPAAVTYFTGRNIADAGSYYITGSLVASVIAVPGAFVGYMAIPYLLSGQAPAIISAAQLYLLFIPLSIITGFSLASLQGQMKMFLWNLFRIIAAVFWLVPLCYLFFLSEVTAVLVGNVYLIFLFIYSCIFIVIMVRNNPKTFKMRREFIKPMWKYALPTHLATFTQQSNLKLDQILIAAFLSPELLGLYVVAVAWSAAHSPLTNAVSYVIVPHLTKLENDELRATALAKITRTSLVLNLIFATAVIALTPFAIRFIFGAEFLEAVSICYILIIGSIFSNMKLVFAEGLRGLGHPVIVMKGELAGLVISGVLFPLLLKLYGLEGVATASMLGYLAAFLFFFFSVKKVVGISFSDSLIPQAQDLVYIYNQLINLFRRKNNSAFRK